MEVASVDTGESLMDAESVLVGVAASDDTVGDSWLLELVPACWLELDTTASAEGKEEGASRAVAVGEDSMADTGMEEVYSMLVESTAREEVRVSLGEVWAGATEEEGAVAEVEEETFELSVEIAFDPDEASREDEADSEGEGTSDEADEGALSDGGEADSEERELEVAGG